MRYVENHDEDRYLGVRPGRAARRAAAAATFTPPGVPMIYYGQERDVEDSRGTMKWYDGDQDLTDFHRRLVSLTRRPPRDPHRRGGPGGRRRRRGRPRQRRRLRARERRRATRCRPELRRRTRDGRARAVAVDGTDLLSETDVADGDSLRVADAVVPPARGVTNETSRWGTGRRGPARLQLPVGGTERGRALGKHGDVRTAGANGVSDENHSEPSEPSARGLSGCSRWLH